MGAAWTLWRAGETLLQSQQLVIRCWCWLQLWIVFNTDTLLASTGRQTAAVQASACSCLFTTASLRASHTLLCSTFLLLCSFVGMKSRGVYETPGGTILLAARRAVESVCLDRGEAHLKASLSLLLLSFVPANRYQLMEPSQRFCSCNVGQSSCAVAELHTDCLA